MKHALEVFDGRAFLTSPQRGEVGAQRRVRGLRPIRETQSPLTRHRRRDADLSPLQARCSRLEQAEGAKSETSDFAGRGEEPRYKPTEAG